MKICSITLFFFILIVVGGCATQSEVATTTDNTITFTTTLTTSEQRSTKSMFEILAAANAEAASVKIANQAYAAEHEGKYASSSSQITNYLTGIPDATYFFNADTGAITKVENGNGITKAFHWDSAGQKWQY
ncbi:MAG: hypothetical protein JW967_06770 [Dehalococcoidales bacterium]|nr:hypothetical protein [Dehalococcoidales bacterium]